MRTLGPRGELLFEEVMGLLLAVWWWAVLLWRLHIQISQ